MMAFAIMRMEKLHSVQTATRRENHNERRKGVALSDRGEKARVIDIRMTDSPIAKERKKKSFADFFKEQTAGMKVRKNAVVGFEVVLTFSPGGVSPDALKKWTGASMQWVAETFGRHNIQSAKLHLSETTPHLHILCGAIDKNGRLAANNIIRGPAHLRELQTQYARQMEPFGLERGIPKAITKAQHTTLREWYAHENAKAERLNAYEKTFGTEREWDMDTLITFTENAKNSPEQPAKEYIKDKEPER